jgi:hypothetical protein
LSNISISTEGATKRSPLSHRQPFTILPSPTRRSKDVSESSKMVIFQVMTIRFPVDSCRYWDTSCRCSLIGIYFQVPELYQGTFAFLLQL